MDVVMVYPPFTVFQGAVSSALTGEMQMVSVMTAQRCLHDRTQNPQRLQPLQAFFKSPKLRVENT